ncbi:hypothetical protein NQ318_005586 [Aromia moschata]|uniref:Small ribosomal subunit protein uS10 domain-containing protein n=1 Tax=Aromia moschata TaxID=1265417 RepID=A0AAV8XJC2_9CUCU|nr:hypothetical protein NQ318_005586 [Aromia moschata]
MNVIKTFFLKQSNVKTFFNLPKCTYGSLYEPDYLQGLKSKVPLYDTLNIQLKGYDYPVLESYQKFVHNLLRNMDVNVEECWAVPAQHMQMSLYKPKSEIVSAQHLLRIYERTVQITDVSTLQLPIILRAIESSLPAGVTVTVRPHEDSDEEVRYIPDSELNTLKQELEDLGGPSRTKK